MRVLMVLVAVIFGFAAFGCGSSSTTGDVNVAEMKKAVNVIVDRCIDESFGNGEAGGLTEIRLAVDDLIRNFETAPDEAVDLGGIKAATPRAALETTVTFLEGEGVGGRPCDEEAANQVHSALASR